MTLIALPDRALNAAVTTMARKVWRLGYDISDDTAYAVAPGMSGSRYASPEAYFDEIRERGRVTVFTGGSDNTIFGEPEINYDFRAWHEWTHFILRAGFDLTGELAVAHRQCEDLALVFGHGYKYDEWRKLVMAEVYGQALYFDQRGEFPIDQVYFDVLYAAGYSVKAIGNQRSAKPDHWGRR